MHGEEREVSTPNSVLMDAITASAQFKKEKRGGKRRRCSQALNGGFRYESDLAHGPKRKVTDEENHFTPASVSPDWAAAVQICD